MASADLDRLAEAQRETVRLLAALLERAARVGTTSEPGELVLREVQPLASTSSERTLESVTKAVSELAEAASANTRAVAGLSKELGTIPAILANLAGGVKSGGGVAGTILKSGLGLAPLASKIVGLFRGRRSESPAAITPFEEPPALAIEVANTENILAGFPRSDREQRGEVRVEQEKQVVVQPQVIVNVSAMDSRSFLDHSGEIARAVREAMLHMHPVNDLISEL